MNVHLVIIDPQNSFCHKGNVPAVFPWDRAANYPDGQDPQGELYVEGATEDMERIGGMVCRLGKKLTRIHVTLDSHHLYHIANPMFWVDQDQTHPDPFTQISAEDVRTGKWRSGRLTAQGWARTYTQRLEDNGRYPLFIWPYHCIIGTWGAQIAPTVHHELLKWELENGRMVNCVTKGSNWRTEHYSAVQADVPDDITPDEGTILNTEFIRMLNDADIIAMCGEALSHCLANTGRDIANNFGEENIKKLVLLTDAASNVTGFDDLGQSFIDEMTARGMQLSTCADFLA